MEKGGKAIAGPGEGGPGPPPSLLLTPSTTETPVPKGAAERGLTSNPAQDVVAPGLSKEGTILSPRQEAPAIIAGSPEPPACPARVVTEDPGSAGVVAGDKNSHQLETTLPFQQLADIR